VVVRSPEPRILYLLHRYPPAFGGGSFTLSLVRNSIRESGFTSIVLTGNHGIKGGRQPGVFRLPSPGGEAFPRVDAYAFTAMAVLALVALRAIGADSAPPTKKIVTHAVAAVAERLRNTPAVCRSCYIHPAVVEVYLASALRGPRELSPGSAGATLRPEERALLALLTRNRPRRRQLGPSAV